MPNYRYRQVAISLVAGGGSQQLFQANSMRVALIVSGRETAGAIAGYTLSTRGTADTQFYLSETNRGNMLPYRDFGPVIRDSIYVADIVANIDIIACEVVAVATAD